MKGFCIWLTGLPGSGKTSTAYSLCYKLSAVFDKEVIILDGDEVRKWLTPDLGYSREDRNKNVIRVATIAKMIVNSGGIAIVSLVSPYDDIRRLAVNGIIGRKRTFLVHMIGHGALWENTEYEIPKEAFTASIKHYSKEDLTHTIMSNLIDHLVKENYK